MFNRFAAQFGDFTLQTTNARFTRVIADNTDNRAIVDRQFAFLQRVTLDLLRQQVTFSNIQLLVFGITGQTDPSTDVPFLLAIRDFLCVAG